MHCVKTHRFKSKGSGESMTKIIKFCWPGCRKKTERAPNRIPYLPTPPTTTKFELHCLKGGKSFCYFSLKVNMEIPCLLTCKSQRVL